MKHSTRRHLAVVPARPAQHFEAFVLDVHRPFPSCCYHPARDGRPGRFEDSEVQPGTYPVRVETSPVGDVLAVVDLDVVITRTVTRRWLVFPRIERPYTRAVSDVAWLTDEVTDTVPALADADGTPLATWRRITDEETDRRTARHCGKSNGPHDCLEPADHVGDHVCAGCHDRWNRGPWDDDDLGDLDPWDGTTCLDDLNNEPDDEETR